MNGGFSFTVNGDLEIVSWGRNISEFTSIPRKTALGKKYFELLPRITLNDFSDAVAFAVEEEKRIRFKDYEFRCLKSVVKADISISPLKNGDFRVTISPSLKCELEKELEYSQDLIDIGKLASTLAHGVRNPLNAIRGAVVYIKEKYTSEKSLIEFADIIEEEIVRLDDFISKFLSASLFELHYTETNINELIKKIEIFTSFQVRAQNIDATYNYGNIPSIKINAFQIEQAILNIINNAIEAMPKGGALTVCTSVVKVGGNQYALIEVTDTGIGMNKKTINQLLEKQKNTKKGRGYGLFISREIINNHGGLIEIRSKQGQGTSIKLYIPTHRKKVC